MWINFTHAEQNWSVISQIRRLSFESIFLFKWENDPIGAFILPMIDQDFQKDVNFDDQSRIAIFLNSF